MSDKKYPREEALAVGNEIVEMLRPFVERIEIAGSIRRGKPFVSDIEILFLPKYEERKKDLLDREKIELASEKIQELVMSRILSKRLSKDGRETYGPLNKLCRHVESGIPVDFFTEPWAEGWARSLVIRTGPRDSNLKLIEMAAKRGLRVHAYGAPFTRTVTGDVIPCDSEQEFYNIVGVTYAEPENRK